MNRCQSCFCEFNDEYQICPECGYYIGAAENPIYRLPHGCVINNRYIIGRTVGSGGFGITYKAWDSKLETIVCIKEYYPLGMVNRIPGTKEVILVSKKRITDYNNGYTRFLDEARNMAKFNGNANIVNVFEFFEENGTAYIVMEYLEGQDLKGFLHNMGGRLDVETSIYIVSEISKALQTIHKKGIIHRDISPDNIFICTNNSIKLIDFGAARFSENSDRNLTIILKPGFAPPEQYEKVNQQGPWTDIYALGATLYMLVTGIKPEESTNRKIKDELPYPHTFIPEIPENISNSIMKAMAVDKHMRFSDMEEFRKAVQGEKKVISIIKEKKKRKKKRLIGILVAMAVVGIGFGIFFSNLEKQRQEETLPEAEIDFWYIADVETERGLAKQTALEAIVSEFMRSNEKVTINLKCYKEDEYKVLLEEALDSGENVPEFFESTKLDEEYMDKAQDISTVYNEIKTMINFNKQILKYCKSTKKLSTSFDMPVIFVNATQFSKEVDKNFEDVTLEDVYNEYTLSEIKKMTNVEKFVNQENYLYYGYTSDYNELNDKLLVSYKIFSTGDEITCNYGDTWSMNSCSEDEEKVVLKLIEFLYSNNAQDLLYFQNDTGTLPINASVLKAYEETNWIYEGLFEEIDNYKIKE